VIIKVMGPTLAPVIVGWPALQLQPPLSLSTLCLFFYFLVCVYVCIYRHKTPHGDGNIFG
jgi:4-hydroxybenzoate polyprenyltransferase